MTRNSNFRVQLLMPSARTLRADIFSSCISAHATASMLPPGPQSPKYLLSGPVHKDFATLGLATQLPKGPDMKTSGWVSMNRKWWGVRQKCQKAFKFSFKQLLSPLNQIAHGLALASRAPPRDPPAFPAGVCQEKAPAPATCVPGPSLCIWGTPISVHPGGRAELWAGVRH